MCAVRLLAILMLTSLATGQQPSNPIIGKSNAPKPELPVIDEYACPGKGNIVPNVKIDKDDRIYPSWKGNEKPIGTLNAGQEVTVLSGVNVIREPGTAIIKYVDSSVPSSLKVGDVALDYGVEADGNILFWAKGTWFVEDIELVAENGQCGFTSGFGPSGCWVDIIKDGISEWWVQVKTSSGLTGWVLAHKFSGRENWWGNFGEMCHYGED